MKLGFDKILKAAMPKRKVNHSKRVAKKMQNMPKDVQYAALFHDYLERGGDLTKIKEILPKKAISLIQLLTNDEESSPLKHMRNVLESGVVDERLANLLILIKIADRKDNYNKRIRNGSLTKKYKKKTSKLLEYLTKKYTGPRQLLKDALK